MCSSIAVAIFVCMSIKRFISNNSGSELTVDVSLAVVDFGKRKKAALFHRLLKLFRKN
jgi:hypothetical protein